MKNYYISIPYNNSTPNGTIFNTFDYELIDENVDGHDIPTKYNKLYKHISSLDSSKRIIALSADYAISAATCTAVFEKYLEPTIIEGNKKIFISDLQVVYITPHSHMNIFTETSNKNLSKSILSNIFNQNEMSFTNHKFLPSPENFTILGIRDIEDTDILKNHNIEYFTISQIKKKTMAKICPYVVDKIGSKPVYIIFDMSVMNIMYAPNVFRFIDKDKDLEEQFQGFDIDDIITIFKSLSICNIIGIDITGFNLNSTTDSKRLNITTTTAKLPLVHALNMKEKKVNVFNRDTQFLIFRNCRKENEYDYGWYILLGLTVDLEEQIIKRLNLSTNKFIPFCLNSNKDEDDDIIDNNEDENVYISLTSMNEQDKISYFDTKNICDCVLFPNEKAKIPFYFLMKK
ncbi:putative arginase [Bodo saltans virus]|uniref:Arginase n=1 Tax=Bodo saltans virus TaxID=2024608 RepID=A0A2H4UVD8_9VIRU|nr:putative arginase [Bodo saltans virus]ATZ80880.1 putative arginase [Bodo saltans virus]